MISTKKIIELIVKYNESLPQVSQFPPGFPPQLIEAYSDLYIDKAVTELIVSSLTNFPSEFGYCLKIRIQPGRNKNAVYIFYNSPALEELHILIKSSIHISQPKFLYQAFVQFGATKIVKVFGGLLIVLDSEKEYKSDFPVITTSDTRPRHDQNLTRYTKASIYDHIIKNNPDDYNYTFEGFIYSDPMKYMFQDPKQISLNPSHIGHDMRLILYQKKAGSAFTDIHSLTPQAKSKFAWAYLNEIKRLMGESFWPIDLKPANTCYAIANDGNLTLTCIDFIGFGTTYTPYKNQIREFKPILEKLLDSAKKTTISENHFYALIEQLKFELSYMMVMFFNPNISGITDALHNVEFKNPNPLIFEEVIYKDRGPQKNVLLETIELGIFFMKFCVNRKLEETHGSPHFDVFLRELRTAVTKDILPEFTDEWIDEFTNLINTFRFTGESPKTKAIIRMVRTEFL